MNRQELSEWILKTYESPAEYPWLRDPDSAIFRNRNGKWFAAILSVSRQRLGLAGEGKADILNVKCDPLLIGSLRTKPGFLPAYHMNKDHWITIVLDHGVLPEEIRQLVDLSYQLTAPKRA